ncbi:MAG TPA: hypothetical protein VNT53_04340 [Pseudolysinimonas sp.]|nr:hypothetical protein [Pseudolysinimonas sp.]
MEWPPESFSILVVCDGNVCRSPSAQFELQGRLPGARVESAGMHAVAGASFCEAAASQIDGEGEQAVSARFAQDFRSRKLREVDVAGFDMVLAATTELRSGLARAHPELRDRFFTLVEAAEVMAELLELEAPDEPITASELIALMNGYRGAPHTLERLPARLRLKVIDPLDIPDAHGERRKRHNAVIGYARESAAAIGDSLARLTIK